MMSTEYEKVCDYLKSLAAASDAGPVKIDATTATMELGFQTSNIFRSLAKRKTPILIKSGSITRLGSKTNQYYINPDAKFEPAKKTFSRLNWIAENEKRQQEIEHIGQRLFTIVCQHWPNTEGELR